MKLDRRTLLLGTLGSAYAASVRAQENDRAFMALWATTQNMKLPGLEGLPADLKLDQLPPQAAAALGGLLGPQKRLQVLLWSPGAAPANATANLDVPAGLQLGPTLPLEILRPEVRRERAEKERGAGGPAQQPDDFEFRWYWGCSETVRPDQPKVWKLSDLPALDRETLRRYQAAVGGRGGGGLEKPDWTEAVWPNSTGMGGGRQPGRIPGLPGRLPGLPGGIPGLGGGAAPKQPGSLKGAHTLRTSYLGSAPFTVTEADFLEPVVFTSGGGEKKPDFKKAMPLAWKPIPTCIGIHLTAFGLRGRRTMVMWNGGDTNEGGLSLGEFPQMVEVRQYVERRLFLTGGTTACTIPAAAFEGCQFAMVQLTAYGPGQAFDVPGQPSIRVQTRSTGSLTLGIPDES